jgi:hypothetical protein
LLHELPFFRPDPPQLPQVPPPERMLELGVLPVPLHQEQEAVRPSPLHERHRPKLQLKQR